MFISIKRFVRRRRRVLATVVALELAVLLFAAHGAASGDHLMDDHAITSTVVAICLAILEVGVVLSVAGMFVHTRAKERGDSALRVFAFARRPLAHGLDPPGLRAAVFQVFLR